jgi:MFS family permease
MVVGIGIGRFAFTPILPLMTEQTVLTPVGGAQIATVNYLGYLAGALLGIIFPRLVGFRAGFRTAAVVTVATLAAMPLTDSVWVWAALRGVCGVASAAVFMTAAASLLFHLRGEAARWAGWGYAGVGAGIVLSGLAVAATGRGLGWAAAWEATAVLAAAGAAVAWNLAPEPPPDRLPRSRPGDVPAGPVARDPAAGRFAALVVSYTLEGTGYVIAGTFLVAAVDQTSPDWVGPGAWTLVGATAAPSCAVWTWLAGRAPGHRLLAGALAIQAVGIALPALFGGAVAAFVSAVLFGSTFMGAVALTMAAGRAFGITRAVAVLTAGYALGQVIGPLVVAATVTAGYRPALAVGAAVVLAAAVAAAAARGDGPPGPRQAERGPIRPDAGGHPEQRGDDQHPTDPPGLEIPQSGG